MTHVRPSLRQFGVWAWPRGVRHIGWLIAGIMSAITLGLIWRTPGFDIPPLTADTPHSLYLLSAIAQSLAAVLALVFTMSLVVAQMASQYSYRLPGRFFDAPTVGYVLFFVVGILTPLWQMARPTPFGARLSLSVTAVALLLLVPFFLSFKDRLNPEAVVDKLRTEALAALIRQGVGEPREAVVIQNVLLSAAGLRDYETFDRGLRAFAELSFEARAHNHLAAAEELVVRLRESCVATLQDPVASIRAVEVFRVAGSRAATHRYADLADRWVKELGYVGGVALGSGGPGVAERVAITLGTLGGATARDGLRDASMSGLNFLQIMAHDALRLGHDSTGGWCLDSIGRIGVAGIQGGLEDVAGVAIGALRKLALSAVERGLTETPARAAQSLGEVGRLAANSSWQAQVDHALDGLRDLSGEGGAAVPPHVAKKAREAIALVLARS